MMRGSVWKPYRPTAAVPWNWLRVWTLYRRAGFGGTWGEIERGLKEGPEITIGRVLAGKARIDGAREDFSATADLLGESAAGAEDVGRLQAWWLFRMLFSPDPLGERMTLLWHNHFATSELKVQNVAAMKRQNETFRSLGRGPFGDLLRAMVDDPALLVWLDAGSNKKGKPNENLARELLELFTLGIGNYSEMDVKEAARALTGLEVVQGRSGFRRDLHDEGTKTILGRSGAFDPEMLIATLLAQTAIARRLAWRLCEVFLGENVADAGAVDELAERLRGDGLHVGRAVEVILRSELFFSDRNMKAQVPDPVTFVVGTVRALRQFDPPPSTLLLAEWTTRMGQPLFMPPNVGGWPGGRSWLSGRAVVARANFGAAVVDGRSSAGSSGDLVDARAEAVKHGRGGHDREALGFFAELLVGRPLEEGICSGILRESAVGGGSEIERFHRAVAMVLARGEAQVD
jgi:uncharacterized protein (DUF1800 family)